MGTYHVSACWKGWRNYAFGSLKERISPRYPRESSVRYGVSLWVKPRCYPLSSTYCSCEANRNTGLFCSIAVYTVTLSNWQKMFMIWITDRMRFYKKTAGGYFLRWNQLHRYIANWTVYFEQNFKCIICKIYLILLNRND